MQIERPTCRQADSEANLRYKRQAGGDVCNAEKQIERVRGMQADSGTNTVDRPKVTYIVR